MRSLILATAFLAVSVVSDYPERIPVISDHNPARGCPAKAWYDGCNNCFCSETGIPVCTQKACINFGEADHNPAYGCPAKTWYDGCNNCFCSETGIAICTQKACINQKRALIDDVPVVYNYKQGDKCPAPVFIDNCNRCICNLDGNLAACTKKACPPVNVHRSLIDDVPVVYGYKQGEKCPAPIFIDNCNRCFCSKNGNSAACTRKFCPPAGVHRSLTDEVPVIYDYKQGDKCPALIFMDNCNRCFCSKDGNTAACTRKLCPPVEKTHTPLV